MSQTFGVMAVCHKHHIPLKKINILGFYVPYCSLCTKPRNKNARRYPVDKKITEAKRIKHKINKEYWDKGAVKISAYKPKPIQEIDKIKHLDKGFAFPKDKVKFKTTDEQ